MSEFLSEVNCHCRKQVKFYSGLIASVCYHCVYFHQALRFDCPLHSFHTQISCWFLFWRFLFLMLKSWLTGMQPCCVLIAAGRWIRAHSDGCEMLLRDRNGRTMDYITMKSPETDADSHVEEASWGACRHKALFASRAPRDLPSSKFWGPAASSLPPHLSWLISERRRVFWNSSKICGSDSCQVTKTHHSFPEMHNSLFFCFVQWTDEAVI